MTAQEKLDDARLALHKLMTGKSVVSIKHDSGKELSFRQADIGSLRAYIADLESQVGGTARRRAIGVRF